VLTIFHGYTFVQSVINILLTIKRYKQEIDEGLFPTEKHTNIIDDVEYNKIENWCLKNNIIV